MTDSSSGVEIGVVEKVHGRPRFGAVIRITPTTPRSWADQRLVEALVPA